MARIGNETNLVLKLAKEKMKASKALQRQLEFGARQNSILTWPEAMKLGFYLGVDEYNRTIDRIIAEIENK